ncbi:MAG TPA: amidohydrolase family protein [Beijerinckiaceae bacterium]|jgi:predicted TIM-barrel fold metal-dependent hydrolase
MSEGLDRRKVLQGLAAATLGTSVLDVSGASAQHQVPWSAGTEAPKLKAPANACDCHMHIYDARFPIAPSATLKPADAKADDYRLLQKRIGTSRNVVVQPSTYGTDNSCTLDGMAKLGPTARGVAVVDTSVTDDELKRLHGLGIRGIRFNLVQAGATTVEMLEPLSKRVNDLGWHVQIHMLGDGIVKIEEILNRLPSPIVFDHMGRIPKDVGTAHPAYAVIGKLIDKGRTWVKLSGAYMDTKVGPPTYADSTKLAQAFAKAAPQRMVWASDWPHPTEKDKPDDAILFDLLAEWVPDEATRNRILVENPATLYDFGKTA